MIVGTVCLSHNPLMDRKRASRETEARFQAALGEARNFAAQANPDLMVVFFPDHLNGFFYDQLPCFCIGVQGESIGDYGTVPGRLDIPEAIAMDCAAYCIKAGVDVSISYKMRADHGASQPIETLSNGRLVPVLPIFINCVAHPRPTFGRAAKLGEAVGNWAKSRPERILLVGSGGLSHDPPLPTMATASPEMKARLINGATLSHSERVARQSRVFDVGYDKADTKLRPLNPEWDRKILEAFAQGDLSSFDDLDDTELTNIAGSGAHELRSWVAALSAAKANGATSGKIVFYEAVPEWITGMGIMTTAPVAGQAH